MLAGLLAGGLAGCAPAKPAAKTEVVIAQGVDATTLDPHMHAETPTANVAAQIFDNLMIRDQNTELKPHLAESLTNIDDLTWEVKLKRNIKFHNGEDFNAESVKFSIERIIDPANKSPQIADLSAVERVDIIDPYTVRIITKAPYPILPARLNLAMVPPGYVREKGNQYFGANPVGTGPYKFVSWVKDDSVVMEANADYWRGAPAIAKVTFRPIPENATRIAELQTGAVDLIVNVPPHMVSSIESGAGTRVARTPSSRIIFIVLNAEKPGPMQNPKVRQALNYAVNVPEIIETVLGGYGYPSTQPLTPAMFGYHKDLPGYHYDPAKAKALLAEAGYPDGLTIDLGTSSGRYVMDKEVAEAIVGQLAAVGITARLEAQEWGLYVGKVLEKKHPGAFLIGWGNSVFDADANLYSWFRSGQRFNHYHTPEIDKLLDDARSTMDTATREALYRTAVEKIVAEAGLLFLYQQEDIYGINQALDWTPRQDELIRVYDMKFSD